MLIFELLRNRTMKLFDDLPKLLLFMGEGGVFCEQSTPIVEQSVCYLLEEEVQRGSDVHYTKSREADRVMKLEMNNNGGRFQRATI